MKQTVEEIKNTLAREQKFVTYYEGLILENAQRVANNLTRNDLKGIERFAKEIVANTKDVAKAKKEVKALKEDLKKAEAEESKNSNDVIDIFLQDWKVKATDYYNQLSKKYKEMSHKEHEITEENLKQITRGAFDKVQRYSNEEIEKVMSDLSALEVYEVNDFKARIKAEKLERWMNQYSQSDIQIIRFDMSRLDVILDREVVSKKKKLISRIENVTGKIVDAQGLYIANGGAINGFVIGEEGKAEVETIYAGGYNIQVLHYRVLVKAAK